MDVLDMANPFERHLCDKADRLRMPIGATFELLPLCNMDCQMCYVRMSQSDLKATGRKLLIVEEWLELADAAKEKGLLFLLLTGGEPFLYPDFLRLYEGLREKGLVVSINTNGTLIDEAVADQLAKMPPRRINISIYGGSPETYDQLCGRADCFDRVIGAVALLKERNLPVKFNYSVTPANIGDSDKIYALADKYQIPVETAYYMFPPARKNGSDLNLENRLTPEQSAAIRVQAELRQYPYNFLKGRFDTIQNILSGEMSYEKKQMTSAFSCRSGSSTYWINWKGEMIPCGMMDQIRCDCLKNGFEKSWKYIQEEVSKTSCSVECSRCVKEIYCGKCAACATAETGCFDGTPAYVCEAADWYVRYLGSALQQLEREMTDDRS